MVKISGTQDIPSALSQRYKQTLTEKGENDFCKKRSPFENKKMRNNGASVTDAQLAQRTKFLEAVALFNALSQADRQRWYSRMPVWNSLLWYYNYFMLEALGATIAGSGGIEAVLKSIQVVKELVPITGGKSFTINEVDPTRTIVLPYGNSFISDKVQRGSDTVNQNSTVNIALSPSVETALAEVKIQGQKGEADPGGEGDWMTPYVSALTTSQLTVALAASGFVASCKFSWEVIERKAQTIYPIPEEINATSILVDWAKEPSVAADVSLIVVEYI